MKFILILNGTAIKQKRFRRYYQPHLPEMEVRLTTHAGHAEDLARIAAEEKPDGIFAGGGDGTLNQVINGVLKSQHPSTPVGVVPLGTANDFAAMCGIRNASDLNKSLHRAPQPTDVGIIRSANAAERYFINVASIGMGPDVVRRLEQDTRNLGPGLTYLRAIIGSFFGHKPEGITAEADDWTWSGRIRSLAIANGCSFGNRLYIAPDASYSDGVLDTFIAGDVPLFTFLRLLIRVRMGKKVIHPKASYHSCRSIRLTAVHEAWMEADGELVGRLPAEISVLPGRLRIFR